MCVCFQASPTVSCLCCGKQPGNGEFNCLSAVCLTESKRASDGAADVHLRNAVVTVDSVAGRIYISSGQPALIGCTFFPRFNESSWPSFSLPRNSGRPVFARLSRSNPSIFLFLFCPERHTLAQLTGLNTQPSYARVSLCSSPTGLFLYRLCVLTPIKFCAECSEVGRSSVVERSSTAPIENRFYPIRPV